MLRIGMRRDPAKLGGCLRSPTGAKEVKGPKEGPTIWHEGGPSEAGESPDASNRSPKSKLAYYI